MLEGTNVCVLDLEVLHSPDDCRHCRQPGYAHGDSRSGQSCPRDAELAWTCYERIGWDDHAALGLSIGCYFDYQDGQCYWFTPSTLEGTIYFFVLRQPLLVSFNGRTFDFPLMQAVLQDGGQMDPQTWNLTERFATLCVTSYDILAEIWKVEPPRTGVRGLNSLDALCQANGLQPKEMDGATAPRLWREGRHEVVRLYCQNDVLRTKGLFEQILAGQALQRVDGSTLQLPRPMLPHTEN